MNILITGASRGLGKAIAEKFAADGASLFLTARVPDQLQATATALQQRFPDCRVQFLAADLGNKTGVAQLASWLKAQSIVPDILVNNAGSFIPGNVHDEPDGALESMLAVNLLSAYQLTRFLLPEMMQRRSGHIFNICSIAALKAYANGGAYSISKFALLGFSKNLREEMKPFQIKVTAVLPGAAYTDSWSGTGINPSRIMEAADIAAMVYGAAKLSPQACVEEIVLRPQLGDL